MESVRPLIVPGPFLLGSSSPPNGGFSNPGVWLMLWTQLTAWLVQCWSSYSISFQLERPLPPWESLLQLSLLEGTRTMSPWVDIVWCPPLCVGLSAWGRFVLLVSLLGTFLWSWKEPPFEPLESVPVRILTLKVTLLLALASFKRVGDLQALSVSESCTEFAPGLVKAFLRPRPGYVPKVLSTSFRSQVVVLQAFSPSPSSEGDDLCLLCPVRALKMYVDRSSQWRQSLQLLVCFGAGRKGLALNTQYPIELGMLFRWPMRCAVCIHL